MVSIDLEKRQVAKTQPRTTRIVVVALGADYDFAATPGFEEGGVEYYSVTGAERMRDVLSNSTWGRS